MLKSSPVPPSGVLSPPSIWQAACEILLVEHQLDTKEYCLFVHKRLRPIRTRPEGEGGCVPGGRLLGRQRVAPRV